MCEYGGVGVYVFDGVIGVWLMVIGVWLILIGCGKGVGGYVVIQIM